MIRVAWAVPFLALAGCAAWATRAIRGHQHGRKRLGCLCRSALIHWLIAWTLACISAVRIWQAVRHPLLYAGYVIARILLGTPRRDPDGEPLNRDEMRAFGAIVETWRHETAPEPERSRT